SPDHPLSERTMNTKTLLSAVALATLAATAAHAQADDRWRQVFKNDEVTWSVDMTRRTTATVKDLGSGFEKVAVKVVWVKQSYAKPQTAGGKEYDTMIVQYFVDCKKHRWAQGQSVARGSDGSVVSSNDAPSQDTFVFTEVVPESVGEAAM